MAEFDWLGSLLGAAAGYAGSGPQTTTVNQSIPDWLRPYAEKSAGRGAALLDKPYEQNPIGAVAPFSPYQFAGFDMMADWAQNSGLPQAASGALKNVLGGGSSAPTGGTNPYMGATTGTGSNPWEGKTTSVGTNPYSGANPYLEQNIDRTLGDITRSYNQNVAPTMAAQAYKSGSFGNTGQQEMEATSRDMLQRNLGSTAGNMRMQDYGMQQQLAESGLNRSVSTQLADYARNAGLGESALNRSMQGQMVDLARNSSLYESGANRALTGYGMDVNKMMTALGMAPSIYGLGTQPGQTMANIGAQYQNLGQNTLNAARQDWNDYNNYDVNLYRNLMYGGDSGSTRTETAPGTNPWASAIGGAGFGNFLFNNIFKPG